MNTVPVFVFGSNLAGRHGRGAAKFAREYRGAINGRGEGRQGNSYGIPTKDAILRSRSLDEIAESVNRFLLYATAHPELQFEVTRIGCGLAGYKEHHIAPFFKSAPPNCILPEGWRT